MFWRLVPLHLIIDIYFGLDYQYIFPKIEVFSEEKGHHLFCCRYSL